MLRISRIEKSNAMASHGRQYQRINKYFWIVCKMPKGFLRLNTVTILSAKVEIALKLADSWENDFRSHKSTL